MQPTPSYGSGGPSFGPQPVPTPQAFVNAPAAQVRFMQVVGVALGIMIFAGFLSFQAVFLVPTPCTTFGCPTQTPDQVAYSMTIHALAWIGLVLLDLTAGLSVMVAFLLNANSSVPEATRRSAFLFASIYLAAFTVFSVFTMSFLLSFVRYF